PGKDIDEILDAAGRVADDAQTFTPFNDFRRQPRRTPRRDTAGGTLQYADEFIFGAGLRSMHYLEGRQRLLDFGNHELFVQFLREQQDNFGFRSHRDSPRFWLLKPAMTWHRQDLPQSVPSLRQRICPRSGSGMKAGLRTRR